MIFGRFVCRGGAVETELSVYQRIMAVNFFGTVQLTRHMAAVSIQYILRKMPCILKDLKFSP